MTFNTIPNASSPQAPPPFADLAAADGVVPDDLACRKCAYNLRGLLWSGLCPECATPVVLSAQSDALRFSHPRWISQMATGAALLIIATICSILSVGASWLIAFPVFRQIPINQLLLTAAAAATTVGVWLLTQPDPAGFGWNSTLRAFLRSATLAILAIRLIFLLFIAGRAQPTIGSILRVLSLVVVIVNVSVEFGKLLYVARLARRIPSERIERRANVLRWTNTICLGILGLFSIAFTIMFLFWSGPARSFSVLSTMSSAMSLVNIVMAVLWIITASLYVALRKSLAVQAAIARQVWSNARESRAR